MKNRILLAIISLPCLALGALTALASSGISSRMAYADGEKDVIASSSSEDYFHHDKTEEQGTWEIGQNSVSVDAFAGAYAMDGANLLTKQGYAYGAFEFSVTIHVTDVVSGIENPMIGFIPWYKDADNWMFVQLKFTNSNSYLDTPEEKADGYALDQLIFSGHYNGEAKYVTTTSQEENTVFKTHGTGISNELNSAKRALRASEGHTLKIRFENNSATALSYQATISYNGVQIGKPYAYYYEATARNEAVGFMAQDVKCAFSDAILNDFAATNNSAVLARDWYHKGDFTYRTLNGIDSWTLNGDGSLDAVTDEVKGNNSKTASNYSVSGSNIAGYDTNRGFTPNPMKEDEDGLPQNYEISASFSLSEIPPEPTRGSQAIGYGLLAWYKDDINFVDVTLRRTVTYSRLGNTTKGEVVLFGWLNASSSKIGQNTYTLPSNFDFTATHELKVQKKSTGFYVYLDGEEVLSKNIKGTELNYFYGYEGYGCKFHASAIASKAIYEEFDEISVLDDAGVAWRAAGKGKDAWSLRGGKVMISAIEGETPSKKRSYLLGASDVSDVNMSVVLEGSVSLGSGYAELMLSPYLVDDLNYARIGLAIVDGSVYARIAACTYTDYDIDEGLDPHVTMIQAPMNGVSLEGTHLFKAEVIATTIALYVDGNLVYGAVIADIDQVSDDYGLYVYNLSLNAERFETDGYKKYTEFEVGGYRTSGMKYNAWTVDEEGRLAGDATYTKEMKKDDYDGERTFAIKENPLRDNYEIHADIIATAQSEAEDRVGVVMWYLDNENFMIFYIDSWREDSTVPRTTIYGKLDGKTLPVTYNHGGWFPEGDQIGEDGLTMTERMQVTHLHSITVIKQGDNFTCYVDQPTQGYISYTVAAGLPSSEGKTVYSGLYTYNDAILVHTYDVTALGGYTEGHTPCEPGHPYNLVVNPPVLGTYDSAPYIDDMGGNGGDNPPTPPSSSSEEPEVIAVKGVSLNRASATITVGDNLTLKATVAPRNATNQNVTWNSSDSSVASVDNNGVVTALKAGSATITVTTADGGFTATCSVSVKERAESSSSESSSSQSSASSSQQEEKKGGCGGSIAAGASILGFLGLGLAGLCLMRKNKHE